MKKIKRDDRKSLRDFTNRNKVSLKCSESKYNDLGSLGNPKDLYIIPKKKKKNCSSIIAVT
jgi:hypothetical protein